MTHELKQQIDQCVKSLTKISESDIVSLKDRNDKLGYFLLEFQDLFREYIDMASLIIDDAKEDEGDHYIDDIKYRLKQIYNKYMGLIRDSPYVEMKG